MPTSIHSYPYAVKCEADFFMFILLNVGITVIESIQKIKSPIQNLLESFVFGHKGVFYLRYVCLDAEVGST